MWGCEVLLPLDQPRDVRPEVRGIPWATCRPFVENSKAVLIHRPRRVSMHRISEKYRAHIAVENWCGNTHTGGKKFTFLDSPTKGRIVCARCEQKAVESGLPSSSQLAGRHVHIGGVVAVAHCCNVTQEQTP